MAKQTKAAGRMVGDIALYGAQSCGHGFIVALADGRMIGDGEPKANRSATDAIFLACAAIRDAGIPVGRVMVFAPGGEMMAETSVSAPGWFGSLAWRAATVYEISADAIVAGGVA